MDIPAAMKGDCGIEGFSKDGIAYQCYEDRDSLTISARTDKQKQKLYRDLRKLKANESKLESILQGTKIQYYFLIVPEFHSSDLVAYAGDQSKVVKSWSLSFIASDFTIYIKTPADYPAEMAAAVRDHQAVVPISDVEVPTEAISEFPANKPELVGRLDNKLANVSGISSADRASLRRQLIHAVLRKEKLMSELMDWPETWDSIERRRISKQEMLEFDSSLDSSPARTRLNNVLFSYRQDLIDHVGGLDDVQAQQIATGQIGEWLMQCPLDFRPADE